MIAGFIPDIFGIMNFTGVMRLGSNMLSGTIPASFVNLTVLTLLDVSYCDIIHHEIPWLAQISNNSYSGEAPGDNLPPAIRYFRASHNAFSSLPSSFADFITMVEVDLSYNAFNTSYTNVLTRLPTPSGQADVDSGFCLQCIFLPPFQ